MKFAFTHSIGGDHTTDMFDVPTIDTRHHVMTRSTFARVLAALLLSTLVGCKGDFPADKPALAAAENVYDIELLRRSLEEIEAWHIKNNTGVVNVLGAGRDVSEIESEFTSPQCQPTEELKTLWSWRDGGFSATPFVWYHDYLPLEDAVSQRQWLRFNPLVQWDPRYIPVFAFEGEWFAAYCGKGSSKAGPIVHYFLEDEPRISYVNLTVFLAGIAEALRTGAIQWENNAVKDDVRKMHSIHQKRNPGYPFPYHVPEGT